MSESLGEMFFKIGIEGTQVVIHDLGTIAQNVANLAKSTSQASQGGIAGLGRSLIFLRREIMATSWALQEISAVFTPLTGLQPAIANERFAISYKTLTNNVHLAGQALADMQRLSERAGIPTQEIEQSAESFMVFGESVARTKRLVESISNTTSTMGLGAGSVAPLAAKIAPLRTSMQGLGVGELMGMGREGVNLSQILKTQRGIDFTGQGRTGQMMAARVMGSMPGYMQYDVLTKGILNSTRQVDSFARSLQSFLNVSGNLMEPTGRLLLGVITPFLKAAASSLSRLSELNRLTNGFLLLPLAFSSIVVGLGAMITIIRAATTQIAILTGQIARLGAGAGASSAASAVNSIGGGIFPIGAGTPAATATGATTATGGFFSKMMGGAKVLLPRLLKGIGTGLAIDTAGNFISNLVSGDGKDPTRSFWGKAISNISSGAGIGATIGSVIPGLGTAVGAGVGALSGIGKTWWDSTHPSNSTQEEIARNTAEMVDSLKAVHGTLMGGGRRGGYVVSSFEAQMNYARMLRSEVAN